MTGRADRSALVLGGTGFLGRHICAALAATGTRVVSVASRPAGPGRAAAGLDLTAVPAARLARLFRRAAPELVVNAAGRVWGVAEKQMYEGNVLLVQRVVEVLARSGGGTRLVHLGSAHEYAPAPAGRAVDERWPTRPATAYGRTKLAGTETVLRAAREHGLDAVVLRVANAIGPGVPTGSLLGTVADRIVAARDGGTAPLRLRRLRGHRDFVDVRDVADAVAAAAYAGPGPAAPVLNVGSGSAVAVRHLVERLLAVGDSALSIVEQEGESGPRGDLEWQQLDIALARRTLSWRPRRMLDESLRDTLTHRLAAHRR